MSLPQEVVTEVFQVIEGGANLGTPAEIIQFPTDNGQNVYNVVQKTYQGSNGTGFNYWVVAFETFIGSVATAVSAGAAMLTLEVGVAGAAIAPALGLTTGYVLYNLTPEFWDSVANELMAAGETIGGKVVTFLNENGVMTFSENAIEIFKNAFLNAGAYELIDEMPEHESSGTCEVVSSMTANELFKYGQSLYGPYLFSPEAKAELNYFLNEHADYLAMCSVVKERHYQPISSGFSLFWLIEPTNELDLGGQPPQGLESWTVSVRTICDGYSMIVQSLSINGPNSGWSSGIFTGEYSPSGTGTYNISGINAVYNDANGLQNGATAPTTAPFPQTFPQWIPWEFPIIDPEGTPQQLPYRFPVEYPDLLPDPEPYQDPAQNPEPATENDPDEVVKTLQDPDYDPRSEYEPEPEPEPDPDPQPEPDPLPDEDNPDVDPDPTDPNRPPTPSIPIVVPNLPATVASGKLFTVYNPTQTQLDALGGYLWDGSIIAAIRDIWQEPLDGVISLLQVYATPATSGAHNIILGFLDSGVSAAVVSNQFVTVDCGSVTIPENKQNATDYAPYTSLHLYLPFIGIVELDTNECMKSTISVKYKIDVYTGTCLATVSVDRDADMPNDPILYTYSGNCSQQIPLTSGNATGMLSALIGGITAGLSVASGGGLGVLAGASIAGQSLTHEMFHVSHSGNISANAGIMGIKKPYLIIGRRHNYDANNYNKFYGFPVNKTVILGNHTGYVEIKKGFLKTSATKPEHDEIMQLLKDGVIL